MDELKQRIKALFEEIESTHLRKILTTNLKAAGIDKSEAHDWILEVGQIVDEYERSLHILIDLIQESDQEQILQKFESWLAYTDDISLFKISDILKYLQNKLRKYLPPQIDDEDEPA